MAQGFLPMTMDEARRRGWDEVDFVYGGTRMSTTRRSAPPS